MTIGFNNTAVDMHMQAVAQHDMMTQQAMQLNDIALKNSQLVTDTFTPSFGILPPKNWTPNKYAGLGPELTPQEKLKKKYEDLRKPMYANGPQQAEQTEQKPKTFMDKVKAFGTRIKESIQNFAKNVAAKFHKN